MASQSHGTVSSHAQRRQRIPCDCGETVVLLTSFTDDNPGRQFLRCLNYKGLAATTILTGLNRHCLTNTRELYYSRRR